MDDDKNDDATSPTGSSRKRAAPTIDLTASSVSDSAAAGDGSASATPSAESKPRKSWRDRFAAARAAVTPSFTRPSFSGVKVPGPARAALSSMLIAGFTGAAAALLVLGAYWFWDSSGGSSRILSRLPTTTAKTDRDSPGKQVAKVEPRAATSTTTAPQNAALASRIDALDKSVAALRDDVAAVRASVEELKATPASQAPDLSAVEERISKIERATVALTGEIAAPQKPATDDPRLRRVAVAAALDAAVNRGEPYAVALSAAKSTAEDASILKPLDEFADKGIPSASALSRELIALLPQILPRTSSQPTGLLDRLQQSAAKMVRIRRVDDDVTTAIAAKAESAARREDVAAARREVEPLSGGSRAPVASWIEKVDAREAALVASRQFASSAASALPKPAQ